MKKDELLRLLAQMNDEVQRKYKARIRGIFGSYVRGQERTGSDLDVLVEFERDADLFHFVGLSLFLEERLGVKVDVVPHDSIRKEIRDDILREAAYL